VRELYPNRGRCRREHTGQSERTAGGGTAPKLVGNWDRKVGHLS
jgi:hypothetical protein